VCTYAGPLAEGIVRADRVVALCHGDHTVGVAYWGYSSLHSAIRTRAELLALMGRLPEALPEIDAVLVLARERAEAEMVCWVLCTSVRIVDLAGGSGDTVAMADEAVRISEDTGNRAFHLAALNAVGVANIGAGRWEEAAAALTRGVEEGRARGLHFEEGRLLAHLARARLMGGDAPGARQAADEAVEVASRQGARVLACHALLVRARVRRVTEGGVAGDAILGDIESALTLVAEIGATTYEPFLREELARLRGDADALREALRLYTAVGAAGHARRLDEELSAARLRHTT
jgi:hypothetical protein